MKIDTSFNNFARAKIDHDMMGRFDLPIYQTGVDFIENFETNFKGNAIYRAGFEDMEVFQDCVMTEFKFNNQQQYICLFFLNKIRFLSYDTNGNFGWVLDGMAAILEVATPYTLAQSRDLDFTQNRDVMVVTRKTFEPYKLTRVSSNSFTFAPFARKNDPFILTNAATKSITAVTQAANASLTITGHGYAVNDRITLASIGGMVELNGYTARVVTVPDANTVTIDINTTLFTAYTSGGTAAKVATGDYPRCCLFYKGRLYYANTTLKITTIYGSSAGLFDDFTLTPVTDASALIFTPTEIAQEIEWLFGGDNSLIAGASDGILAINGGGVKVAITAATVDAILTSAPPCNSAKPLKKDSLIFYVGVDGRNVYYFNYDLLQESFTAEDANVISYDITLGGIKKIRHKKDRNDLIFATTDSVQKSLLACNFYKKDEIIIGWNEQPTYGEFLDEAVITDNNGKPQLFTLSKRNGSYYIERKAEYVEFKHREKFFTGVDEKDADDMAYARYISEQLKSCLFLDNATIISDLQSNLITFNGLDQITATADVFASDDVDKHIVYKTATGYESGRFLITGYTSAKIVTVEVLQAPTANTYTDWYLSFSTVTGLSQYNGQTVSVVADGGYLSDYDVTGSQISFDRQVTHVSLGYKYRGILKSFCLGLQIQGVNTQTTMKAASQFGIRCVSSAGLKIGTSSYRLEPVQELAQGDLNYLPPLPIDGTKYVSYSDDNQKDKYFYVVQDEPLPATVTCVIINGNHATSP